MCIVGTMDRKLCYKNEGGLALEGYCDSYYAADKEKRRSTSGVVFTFGGNTISWRSSLQKVVALSSTKAEYMFSEMKGRDCWEMDTIFSSERWI